MSLKHTACPLDCYDACRIEYKDEKCKPSKNGITNGKLCKLFAYLQNEETLSSSNIPKILEDVVLKFKEKNKKVLYYKGSGNMGVMQHIPKKFFESIKATFAMGSICESSGEAGIEMGRVHSINPPTQNAINSDVVIVWGRNFKDTSRHIYELVKDKPMIVIDPLETSIAKEAEVFFQIPPKGDYQLSLVLMDALKGKKVELKRLEELNINQEQIDKTINLLRNKKVAVMLGLGAQKYFEGATIIHEMEKFFDALGVFKENNGGVWYLGNSTHPFNNKLETTPTNTTSYPNVDFGAFDIIFIHGANPAISAPNTKKVIEGLKKTFVIYMGTTQNETSVYADIIIPAKTFLQKKDVRLSYAHDEVMPCEVCEENDTAVSEYELTSYLMDAFNFEKLLNEDEYLDCFKEKVNERLKIKFTIKETKNVDLLSMKEDEYYLLASKSKNTINSQFKYDEYAYVHPSLNLKDEQKIILSSNIGSIEIRVKNDNSLYPKAILIYAGNKDANYLTPDVVSEYGDNACFQEIKLTYKIA
ncbi:MAG TPA: hypothetical protein EYG97_00730 [Arcobacter sp.]|nr:hypothetical protein [Arcobacter sp.]HIP55528.1 hypothetical protein [Arcobacter sp.]